jgi:hypothetical protein
VGEVSIKHHPSESVNFSDSDEPAFGVFFGHRRFRVAIVGGIARLEECLKGAHKPELEDWRMCAPATTEEAVLLLACERLIRRYQKCQKIRHSQTRQIAELKGEIK